ncbi:MAG: 3-deoxy-D-manno-octulosonic acid transferase [Schleiferiaceae bacterium]|jgi:3-deoxy-D-manno-octulosonic-acid transferase|nr:3-deoxy-D-manno-octulosonic acid transferase [Schleiferiaceae bacterium]
MRWLYSILIHLYGVILHVAALFNPKARLWVDGRKNYFEKLSQLEFKGHWVWFHTASLGEYEQAKPVIAELKKSRPDSKFLVTFFSPSGYEIRKNDETVDSVLYLPLDTKKNASQFLDRVNPELAVFVRYEFWPNFLDGLHKREIPTAVIAANFRESQFMFSSFGGYVLNRIKKLSAITVQTEKSVELLTSNGVEKEKISVAGNSRVDQVAKIASNKSSNKILEAFSENRKVLILGSSYAKEESFIRSILIEEQPLRILIAPHYVDEANIKRLINSLPVIPLRYSLADEGAASVSSVMILDTMGMLAQSYQYGDYALVGGGFNDGLHSILEPAAFGHPTFFGPKHHSFPEATALIEKGGAFEVTNSDEFEKEFNKLFESELEYERSRKAVHQYISEQKGAANKIAQVLLSLINQQ